VASAESGEASAESGLQYVHCPGLQRKKLIFSFLFSEKKSKNSNNFFFSMLFSQGEKNSILFLLGKLGCLPGFFVFNLLNKIYFSASGSKKPPYFCY